METRHNTTGNTETIHTRVRSGLIVLGIITSIICSLILLKDIPSTEHTEASLPALLESSEVVPAMNAEIKPVQILSAIWTLD